MKKLIPALVFVLVLCACSGDRPMSKSAYTEDFARQLRQADPTFKVEITADLELKITTPAGHPSTAHLDNGYKEYLTAPQEREAIMAKFIHGFIESSRALASETPLDRTMITPIIKDRAWITDILASKETVATSDKPVELVYEPLNPELMIVYAEDSPRNLTYLTPAKLNAAGLKTTELRALAVLNLKRLLPQVEARGGNGIYMLTAGGTYEASLLLFDDMWREGKLKVDGHYVVSVPSRDMLLITGSNNREGIRKVRELAKATAAEASYHLTTDLFIYRDGRFVRFDE